MSSQPVTVNLTSEEVRLLIEALDAYEYWQLGDVLPRDDGLVFLPEDEGADRYWDIDRALTEEEQEAARETRACRELAQRLLRPPTVTSRG